MRGFLADDKSAAVWPAFKWSHDDKFLARMGEDVVSVYETPSMDMVDKKSIKIEGVKDFSWSPSQNIISYFVPERSDQPATVVLIDIPSKAVKRTKNLFNVNDCKLHWHSNGDFLAVKVDRMKNKKTISTNFEVFRMKEKNIPIENVELKDANVVAFAWEPKGLRFAVIHGEGAKPDVSLYVVESKIKHLKTLEKRSANGLYWSPQGEFLVIAGLNNLNGVLEFYNANDLETMGTEEHYNAASVEWDPSGRCVATIVAARSNQVETGYNLYSFQGKLIRKVLKEKFYQLLWRPRPSILSDDKQKEIKKNLHKYFKMFKEEDRIERIKVEEERYNKREEMRKEFEHYMLAKQKEYEAESEIRRQILGDEEDDDDFYYQEEWVEEIEDRKEVISK